MKISGVYKITNTVTNDFYIGSSKNVKKRWACHKCPSVWKDYPNKQLYMDMQKYGIDKFDFQILAEVESEKLKETEQQFIEKLLPTYNKMNAKGWNTERYKESHKKYTQSEKGKEAAKRGYKKYNQSEKCKEYHKMYYNQLCYYNGEILKLSALLYRFHRDGINHPTQEARKYLLDK